MLMPKLAQRPVIRRGVVVSRERRRTYAIFALYLKTGCVLARTVFA